MHVRDLARVAASSEGKSPCGVDHGQPQRNRFDLYQRFTGQALPAGPDAPRERSKLLLRRSVLDLVSDDLNRLRRCVGIADSIRLDQHEASVRALELRLAALGDESAAPACVPFDAPTLMGDERVHPAIHKQYKMLGDRLSALTNACRSESASSPAPHQRQRSQS